METKHHHINSNASLETRLKRIEDLLQVGSKSILNIEDLALYTGYRKSYLYKLTSQNQLPFYRPNGKQIYFKKSEIDEWLLRNPSKTNKQIEEEAIKILNVGNGKH